MIWVVGIDEAGYGPNLGPLCQAAVAVQLPETELQGWSTFAEHIRQATGPKDKRIVIDDSKQVYVGPHGLKRLEIGLAAMLGLQEQSWAKWLANITIAGCFEDIQQEAWFEPQECIPLHDLRSQLPASRPWQARIIGAKVMTTPIFNRVVQASGTKATALSLGLMDLLAEAHRALPQEEPILITIDKQGGRQFYAPFLQTVFDAGWVVTEQETPEQSRYRIEGLTRIIRVLFVPRADGESMAVALASMLAKYLREVCMRQFNRYWARHIPGLAPTAGYPQDAKRFYAAIEGKLEELQLTRDQVWRMK